MVFLRNQIYFKKRCSLVFLSCNCDNKQLRILTPRKLREGHQFQAHQECKWRLSQNSAIKKKSNRKAVFSPMTAGNISFIIRAWLPPTGRFQILLSFISIALTPFSLWLAIRSVKSGIVKILNCPPQRKLGRKPRYFLVKMTTVEVPCLHTACEAMDWSFSLCKLGCRRLL